MKRIRKKRGAIILIAILTLYVLRPVCTYATNWSLEGRLYYVSTTGNDQNPGTDQLPFATIQKAVETAQTGEKVLIRAGIYHEIVLIENSGTPDQPIEIAGYPGEEVVIDGKYEIPIGEYPKAQWKSLFTVAGDFVKVHNLTVKNSRGRGFQVQDASKVVVSQINANYNWNSGIHVVRSNNITVEACTAWQNGQNNAPPIRQNKSWPAALLIVDSEHCLVRGNEVYKNHGEGIDDARSDYTVIEDNIAYDNYKINIYLDNSQYSTVRRNLVYSTNDTTFWRYGESDLPRPTPGIVLNDEPYKVQNPAVKQVIINNLVYNTGSALAIWGIDDGNDLLIANNTLVNTLKGQTGQRCLGISIGGVITNSVIANNIIYHEQGGRLITGKPDGITFSHNNWSHAVDSRFSGKGDVINDPQLLLGEAQSPTPDSFKLNEKSPVRDRAKPLDMVSDDFFRSDRTDHPDIGAIEFRNEGIVK